MDSASSSPVQLLSPTKSAVYDYDVRRYHRYTDTCLFYPSALSTRRRRKEGYMRRYSTSSIESSQTTVTNRSIHRKALSLSTFQLLSEQESKATIVNNNNNNNNKASNNKLDYTFNPMTMTTTDNIWDSSNNISCKFIV